MSRRIKVAIGCAILMLIVSAVLRLIVGQDEWFEKAIETAIIYGFGVAIGYSEGKRD